MIPERYAPMAYALFRIVFGFIFFMFGMQKIAGWFGGQAAPLMSMFGAAGVIETVCGLLIMTGFLVRPRRVPRQRRDGCRLFHRARSLRAHSRS